MFDVGFTELVVIALVALIVIGPERLPRVARTAGVLLGRLQRYVSDVKADINREIQLDDLKKMQTEVATQVREMQQSVTEQMQTVETELNQSIAAGIEAKAEAEAALTASADAVVPAAAMSADAVPAVADGSAAAEKPQQA